MQSVSKQFSYRLWVGYSPMQVCMGGMTNMYLSLHAEADPVFSEGGLESGMDLEERG